MTLVEPQESKKDVNVRTAQLVQLLTELGPDIPEISRRLGQFKESVRYRYKEKILNKGMAVQAVVDHERLGLRRVIFIADFAPQYKSYAQTILTAMSEVGYVINFAKTLPEGTYVVHASVPADFVDAYTEFIQKLQSIGLFTSVEVMKFGWARNIPMRAEFYDFGTGRWDYDWSPTNNTSIQAAAELPPERGKFDYTDLLILKELQMDANKQITEIADKLNVNYKKLAWHYSTHVVGGGLVKGYRVNWTGTGYDYKIDRSLQRKHKYVVISLIVRNVSKFENLSLIEKSHRLPFLWGEASGENYYAEFAFPVDFVTEALQYLESAIEKTKDRTSYHILDWTSGLAFTISYKLYDQSTKKWIFDSAQLIPRFETLLVQIKEGAG